MAWILSLILWTSAGAQAPSLDILDTKTLNGLEENGYSLGEMLGGTNATRTDELYKTSPFYRVIAETVGKPLPHDPRTDQLPAQIPQSQGDIPEMVRLIRNFEDKGTRSDKDLKGGYFIRQLSNNSQYPYQVEFDGDEPRHFDDRWLNSKFAFMKLIAVVNRMDRADFDPAFCGEVRFIYRLSYHSPKSSSSLPFFMNIVRQYPKRESCAGFAKRWTAGAAPAEIFKDLQFKQAEFNFQSLRFTSGYMHDFGGQAMYMQRIFRPLNGKLQPVGLENTPDVLAIERNPELLKKFVAFLKTGDHLQKLDQGFLQIDFDPAFLAKIAVTWSTLGRARTANKPYSRLFQNNQSLLKSIDISQLKFIKSHGALVERLNNLTCMGCHQSGGTAGFHMLGLADEKFSHGFNRQELAHSPHAFAENSRRMVYVRALAEGRTPIRFRPHSNFPVADWSGAQPKFENLGAGQICLLKVGHFAPAPSCAAGTECRATVSGQDVMFGECVKTAKTLAGSACWRGEIRENADLPRDRGPIPTYNLFAFRDKWKLTGSLPAAEGYKCVLPQSGAPLGRSTRPCTLAEENFAGMKAGPANFPVEICANQGGNGFDLCAATGDSGACLEARVVRSMLDTCSPGRFCREDYICQRIPEYQKISPAHYASKKNGKRVNMSEPSKINGEFIRSANAGQLGFCVPTYFLFNMRLDGHPSPVTGVPPGEPKVDRKQPLRGYL